MYLHSKYSFRNRGAFPTATQNRLENVYSEIPDVQCNLCGECCYTVPVFFSEYIFMVDYIYTRIPNSLRQQLMYLGQNYHARWDDATKNFRCSFFSEANGLCLIYPARPYICRLYGHQVHGTSEKGCSRTKQQPISQENVDKGFRLLSRMSRPFAQPFPVEFWIHLSSSGLAETLNLFKRDSRFMKVMISAEMLANRLSLS